MAKRLQKVRAFVLSQLVSFRVQEFKELSEAPMPWATCALVNDNMYLWRCTVQGPVRLSSSLFPCPICALTGGVQENSPYEKGIFTIELEIPTEYPFKPPKVRCCLHLS